MYLDLLAQFLLLFLQQATTLLPQAVDLLLQKQKTAFNKQ